MSLDPRLWFTPPPLRRFPDEIADVYEAEDTPLVDVCELWSWKYDLVTFGPNGPTLDQKKMADRIGIEVSDFLRIEEESASSQAAIDSALSELDEFRKGKDT